MYSNLPCGCTDEDIEVYFGGLPISKTEALEDIALELQETLSDEDMDDMDDEEFNDLVEEEFRNNWTYVNYIKYGSGYVHR